MIRGHLRSRRRPLNFVKTHIKTEIVDIAKHGGAIGLTFGTCNPVLTQINPTIYPSWEGISKAYGSTGNVIGNCHSITKRGERKFVHPGDSGSIIVHDKYGAWLGLLLGESSAGSGLMIPMAVVFNDIEKVTGYTMVEPELESILNRDRVTDQIVSMNASKHLFCVTLATEKNKEDEIMDQVMAVL